MIEKLEKFSGIPQELNLPSAPKQFIRYMEEDNRPQVQLDVDYENGMGVSVGRLREDTVYDWKFIGLSHNTIRGAAGGAVLCAELLKACLLYTSIRAVYQSYRKSSDKRPDGCVSCISY